MVATRLKPYHQAVLLMVKHGFSMDEIGCMSQGAFKAYLGELSRIYGKGGGAEKRYEIRSQDEW